jgi:multimeric flavodoxin WrbA
MAKGILEKKHKVTVFDLIKKSITPCVGCLLCEDGEDCALNDDYSKEIMPASQAVDLVIFAPPTYFNIFVLFCREQKESLSILSGANR